MFIYFDVKLLKNGQVIKTLRLDHLEEGYIRAEMDKVGADSWDYEIVVDLG